MYVRVSAYCISHFRDRKATLHTTEDEFTGIATVDVKSTHALSDNSTQRIEEIKNRKRRRGSHRQEQCKSSKERSRKGITGKSVGENRKTAATETKTMNERESCERKSGGRSEGLTLHRRGL
nr:hypothetical protein Iba_chr02bCG5850 [Ipomoea batatas]GMD49457.1 hypothetical protein Iba_scaffold46756CG0650 [Ipomoea batatas]